MILAERYAHGLRRCGQDFSEIESIAVAIEDRHRRRSPVHDRDGAAEHRDAAGIAADAALSSGWNGLDECPAGIEDEQLIRGQVRSCDDERTSGVLGSRRARRDGEHHQHCTTRTEPFHVESSFRTAQR